MKKNIKRNKSKLVKDMSVCFICGKPAECIHEVFFGTANRRISIEDGMYLGLCNNCHNFGNRSVHLCRETDLYLKKYAQKIWEETCSKDNPRKEFIKRFGKSWLD